jgi:hypothetical protein
MPQAVTNRARLCIIKEVTAGTTPTSSPRYQPIRYNSASLSGKPNTIVSDEIISDRMVGDLIVVGKTTDGSLDFETSYYYDESGGLDQLFEGALATAWVATPEKFNLAAASPISAVSATAYTTSAASPAWNQWMLVQASGFTNSANNGLVLAGVASSSTSIVTTGKTVEASPPIGARLKMIGFQASAAADVQTSTTGANKLTSTATDFTKMGLAMGQWVLLGTNAARAGGTDAFSFATAANNGWCRIGANGTGTAITATVLPFDIIPTGFATDTAAGKTIRVFVGDYARNGSTVNSYTVEQFHTDITQYQYFKGCVVNQLSFTMDSQAIVKGTAAFIGMDTTITATQIGSTPSNATAPTYDVMNTSSNVGRLAENGTAITGTPGNYVLSIGVQIDNNARAQNSVGSIGAIAVVLGRSMITGSLKMYFADTSVLAKAIAGTATSLDWAIQDAAGNAYHFDVPKVKLTTAEAPIGGLDQDVTVNANWQALKHGTLGYQLQVERLELAGTAAATI